MGQFLQSVVTLCSKEVCALLLLNPDTGVTSCAFEHLCPLPLVDVQSTRSSLLLKFYAAVFTEPGHAVLKNAFEQ